MIRVYVRDFPNLCSEKERTDFKTRFFSQHFMRKAAFSYYEQANRAST